ncbi:hypothetical protein JQ543_30705 [Bradyrhizobium diazoefficiens]|nr:hypothetical protein [Bradyrhizobium diazoefficiens]MBR0852141.1 hypothetical protein [Bradyrhizobium diazoefficiens]
MLELPTMARIKLDRLDSRGMELHDSLAAVTRRASDLSRALTTAPESEHASIGKEISRLQGRMTDLQEQHRNIANLVAAMKHWIAAAHGNYEMAKTPKASQQRGEPIGQAVARVRDQIKALAAERVRVLQCGLPAADLKKQASAFVVAQRERGKPKLAFGHDRTFQAQFDTQVDGAWTATLDIGAALAWFDPDCLEKRLHEAIDRLPQPALAMSSDDRGAKLLELEAELLARERDEEALIELSEEQGAPVHRKLDADPRAVLGIALVGTKKPKPERIKAA